MMKQKQYSPLGVAEMALSLFAVNEGFLDDVDVKKVVDFESALQSYARSNHGDVLDRINRELKYDEETTAELSRVLTDFKANGSW
jgi:F-type H+/Na+-transporting ATPase subunit alpha